MRHQIRQEFKENKDYLHKVSCVSVLMTGIIK